MPRRLAALALLALFVPQLALAEQARIAVFEAVARAEPRPGAAPLETFVEGTAVSVSEDAQAGWRRMAGVATAVIAPKGGDLLDVINAWNVRHPDQPFTIGDHTVER